MRIEKLTSLARTAMLREISGEMKTKPSKSSILEAADGWIPQRRLTKAEVKLIQDIVLRFNNNGTPLSRECVYDFAGVLI